MRPLDTQAGVLRRRESTEPRFVVPAGLRDDVVVPALLLAGVAHDPGSLSGRTAPLLWRLEHGLSLGRDVASLPPDLGAALGDDRLVSRQHAQIDRRGDGAWIVRDLGSTNGTRVDDRCLPAGTEHVLGSGSVIGIGGHVLVFRLLRLAEIEAIEGDARAPFGPLATLSGTLATVKRRLRRLARAGAEVLLIGETGVGKEVGARAMHAASARPGRLVTLNCAALPDHLVESELFGYVRGAHSTATESKSGLVEAAHRGTLFLDEIGEMSLPAQAKLLRFLQDRALTSLGSTQARELDVHVVAATNREPDARGQIVGLRPDLLARFGPEPVPLVPLRERIEDVGTFIAAFTEGAPRTFDVDAHFSLFRHGWPGNVRQLRKTIEHAVAVTDAGDVIGPQHLPAAASLERVAPAPTVPIEVMRRPPTRKELESLLVAHGGNVADVARELGRQRTLVWRWLRQHGLRPERASRPVG